MKILKMFAVIVLSLSFLLAGCGEKATKITVDSIEISKKNLYLAEGQTAVISAQVYPFNATDQAYSFESSDSSVVKIEDGFVTAVSAGDAKIYAFSEDGGYKDTCNVLVTKASENLALNNYNNLNMPKKDLSPIYNSDDYSSTNTSAKKIASKLNTKISEENNENTKSALSVYDDLKQELKSSIDDLETQKQSLKQNAIQIANETKDSFFSTFNDMQVDILDSLENMKKSMLENIENVEQKVDSGEYSVESQDINGITFVVIKNSTNPSESQSES